ncbi:MAG TPA: hypothetical protein DCQ64_23920 [Candidatus Rokubacteria bacterium]|nr:hypothetical protein [Candidatus Rokubacteria bacterium]
MDRVSWVGNIADLSSAFKVSGSIEGGGRVTFDVPENQLGEAIRLVTMRRKPLRITVEVMEWEEGRD